MNWTGIDFGLYGVWSLLGGRSKLRAHLRHEETYNTITAALYRRAAVGLNLHRTSKGFSTTAEHVLGAESMNPRCYELAASGLFFTTDARAEVREIFGDVLPTFSNPVEAEAIIRRALAEPEWRADVAAQCRELVQDDTWTQRAAMVLDALHSHSAAGAAKEGKTVAKYAGRKGLVYMSASGTAAATTFANMTTWSISGTAAAIDVTAFGDANLTYVQGLKDVTGTFQGWYDDSASAALFPQRGRHGEPHRHDDTPRRPLIAFRSRRGAGQSVAPRARRVPAGH